MEKKEICNVHVMYREWGYYLNMLEQYARALEYFQKAIEKDPSDLRTLMGRAWDLSKVVNYEEALINVNKALELAPNNLIARAHLALITYLTCEFEEGLVQNTRLIPKRKKPENFVMGVMHCTEAIQNCLGERCGRPLRDHFKIIRRIAWRKHFDSLKPYAAKARKTEKKKKKRRITKTKSKNAVKREQSRNMLEAVSSMRARKSKMTVECEELVSDILDTLHSRTSEQNFVPPYCKPFPFKPLQNYTKNIANYMAEKYLDCMYLDKIYLKKIQGEKGIKSPNYKGTVKIKNLAKAGFKTVEYKQELLRTRRPFYYLKYHEAESTGELKSRQEKQFKMQQEKTSKHADKRMKLLNTALVQRNLKGVLRAAENLITFCEKAPKTLLLNRKMYMEAVYTAVCNAHYDTKRLNTKQYIWDQEKRILVMFGMPVSREPSQDSVIAQFKDMLVDYRKQVEVYEKRLKKADSSEETAWIYHELSRCYSEMKQYELSRMYARKCITEGRICENPKWVINALTLIIKAHVQQSHKNDAKNELMRAVDVSQEIGDPVVEEFMTKALEVIQKVDFEDVYGSKELEKREKKIIGLMQDTTMQSEAAHLFRMMSTMPAARRMSVMPGIKLEDADDKKALASRKMSILPSKKRDSDGVGGKKDFMLDLE